MPTDHSGEAAPEDRLSLTEIARELDALRLEMRREHVAASDVFEQVHPAHRRGAQNLVDFLTLRSHDVRSLQASLARLGLSSLGRSEAHVLSTIEHVLEITHRLENKPGGAFTEAAVGFEEGEAALVANTDKLFGPQPTGRQTRIMVTLDADAAGNDDLVRDLLEAGMDCARINTAHDGPDEWASIAETVRRVALALNRTCPIFVDLPGPKLRTGPIVAGPPVLRIRPTRDLRGRAIKPALIELSGDVASPTTTGHPLLPVDAAWLARRRLGEEISLLDTRGSKRRLKVVRLEPGVVTTEVWDTTYVETGTQLIGDDGSTSRVGTLAAAAQTLRVAPGDLITLTGSAEPADPRGTPRTNGSRAYVIGCTLPVALEAVEVGHRVLFDDGKLGGTVVARRPGEVDVGISLADPTGTRLGADKGINFPDTDLDIAAIDERDASLLGFVAAHADAVELSFAQRLQDVTAPQRQLASLHGEKLALVLKIETVRGFTHLPELLLEAMHSERVAVMVARGDLAVECGYERLAEVQEEILSLCAAAHVPVIWATEVLDRMAKTGHPTRAEVSDASMAGRAECVMLNKGPHIVETVRSLDDILRRMGGHQRKRQALLRKLQSWS